MSEPSIATVAGIRVGSSLAEVRGAYGNRQHGTVQGGHGKLVLRSDDPKLGQLSLGLWIAEDTVVDIWAGRRAAVEDDEACA